MGGSQGARRLNLALLDCVSELLERYPELCVTHQSGRLDWERVSARRGELPASISSRYIASPFFDDIGKRIADSDLVVMRAGGSSLAECSALGRPMILVPYPHAGGHQRFNADPFARAGAAIVVNDESCDGPRLLREVSRLIDHPDRWRAMAAASLRMGIPDADSRVISLIRDAAAQGLAA
jgi:UDP-N-acetylglucosamine--N-acetylmuramyl-(pentapeptide) pyrophosphoryl-undecaprenol N-acetylglucosamine transferase